jgi:RNA polymerase sigma factor (sigma-70 family)
VTSPQPDPQEEFAAWYERDFDRLFSYITYRLRDKQVAEELATAICEKALTYLDRYDPSRGSLHGWVLGIARNELLHHMRDHKRQTELVALDDLPEVDGQGATMDDTVYRAEITRRVLANLHILSEREQELIALRYGADLPHEEIARMVGLTAGNVRVLIHRALDKLHRLLEDYYEAENA